MRMSFLGTFAKLRKAALRQVRPSACSDLAHTGRIAIKYDVRGFLGDLSRTRKPHYNPTLISGTLNVDLCIYDSFLLNSSYNDRFSDQSCRGNQNTHLFWLASFFSKTMPLLDNVENVEKYCRAFQAQLN
jgi:hypothetical protein